MGEITIEGRRVYIAKGRITQTVNVCDANNRRGQYDWIMRLPIEQLVEDTEVKRRNTICGLIEWLQTEHGGVVESSPFSVEEDTDHAVSDTSSPPVDEETSRIRQVVEECIDELLREFLEKPFLHRVEHSLHVRLMQIMASRTELIPECELMRSAGRSGLTQLVHKEWPETNAQEYRRRGNFDIVVLSPDSIRSHTLAQFRNGSIRPIAVVEMGLDYPVTHLRHDAEKMLNSEVTNGYLVHLDRGHMLSDELKKEIEIIESASPNVCVAVGIVHDQKRWVKYVGQQTVTEV